MFRLSRANSRTTHWKANMIWRRKIEEIESVESDLRYRKRECVNWYDPISYGANCLNHSILFSFLCSLLSTYLSTATVGCAGRVHGGCHNIILPLKLLIHFGHKLKHVRQQIGGFGFLCLNSAFSQSVHGTQTILCVMPLPVGFTSNTLGQKRKSNLVTNESVTINSIDMKEDKWRNLSAEGRRCPSRRNN